MSRIPILVALLFCGVPKVARTQEAAPPDLSKAIKERGAAVDKVDMPAWERYTTTRFTVVQPTGKMLSHAERTAELRQAKPAATPSKCDQERTTVFADGLGATHRCLQDGIWWLTVLTKAGTEWKVVAVQGTTAAK